MKNKLKPCPFCGSNDIELQSDFDKTKDPRKNCMTARVKCCNCFATSDTKDSCGGETEQDAIDAWNKRAILYV